MTLEGRLTLMELIRRLRYGGYLDLIGITEREPGEVFEKLIDHLASTQDWSRISAASGGEKKGVSTGSGSDRVDRTKKSTSKKASKKPEKSSKSQKAKVALPEPEQIITEPVKLYYVVDRRDFLEKVRSVYAAYAA